MKKIILAITILTLAATQAPKAEAHGVPVAAFVGGVAVGTVVGATIAQPVYCAPSPVVYTAPAPVVVASAPVVYTQPGYICAPVVTYGFGVARPIYRGYYGHPVYHFRR